MQKLAQPKKLNKLLTRPVTTTSKPKTKRQIHSHRKDTFLTRLSSKNTINIHSINTKPLHNQSNLNLSAILNNNSTLVNNSHRSLSISNSTPTSTTSGASLGYAASTTRERVQQVISTASQQDVDALIDFANYDEHDYESDIGSDYENQLFDEERYQQWLKQKYSPIFQASFQQFLYAFSISRFPPTSFQSNQKNNQCQPPSHLLKEQLLQTLLNHHIIIPIQSQLHNRIPDEILRIKQTKVNEIWQKLEQFQIIDEDLRIKYKPGFADPYIHYSPYNNTFSTPLPAQDWEIAFRAHNPDWPSTIPFSTATTAIDIIHTAMVLAGGKDFIDGHFRVAADNIAPYQLPYSDFSNLLPMPLQHQYINISQQQQQQQQSLSSSTTTTPTPPQQQHSINQFSPLSNLHFNTLPTQQLSTLLSTPSQSTIYHSDIPHFSLTDYKKNLRRQFPDRIYQFSDKNKIALEQHILHLELNEPKLLSQNDNNTNNNSNNNNNIDNDHEHTFNEIEHLYGLFEEYHRYDVRRRFQLQGPQYVTLLKKLSLIPIEKSNVKLTSIEFKLFHGLVKSQLLQYLFDLTYLFQPQVHLTLLNQNLIPIDIQTFYQQQFKQSHSPFNLETLSSVDLIDTSIPIVTPALKQLTSLHDSLYTDVTRHSRVHIVLSPPIIPQPIPSSTQDSSSLSSTLPSSSSSPSPSSKKQLNVMKSYSKKRLSQLNPSQLISLHPVLTPYEYQLLQTADPNQLHFTTLKQPQYLLPSGNPSPLPTPTNQFIAPFDPFQHPLLTSLNDQLLALLNESTIIMPKQMKLMNNEDGDNNNHNSNNYYDVIGFNFNIADTFTKEISIRVQNQIEQLFQYNSTTTTMSPNYHAQVIETMRQALVNNHHPSLFYYFQLHAPTLFESLNFDATFTGYSLPSHEFKILCGIVGLSITQTLLDEHFIQQQQQQQSSLSSSSTTSNRNKYQHVMIVDDEQMLSNVEHLYNLFQPYLPQPFACPFRT